MIRTLLLSSVGAMALAGAIPAQDAPITLSDKQRAAYGTEENWPVYLGNNASTHYSWLDQINTDNVADLEIAWTYTMGEAERGDTQTNPLIVHGILYGITTKKVLFALDAATGEELWRFDPASIHPDSYANEDLTRGLVYWEGDQGSRILMSGANWIYAIDAQTGEHIADFGEDGAIDLRQGLGRDIGSASVSLRTPGIVHEDTLIIGSNTGEGSSQIPGHIRAYDIVTGEQKWIFHTIPHPGEHGYETWPEDAWQYVGGANNWPGMALDDERGIVYIPTGSATNDFQGHDRLGDNWGANTLLALDAQTGERIWDFQIVHHDLLDRDPPAPPNLLTVNIDGQQVDAVAQVTKTGHVFLFDRETGEPLHPIEDVPSSLSEIEGEIASDTQPVPQVPEPFVRQYFTEDDITNRTPEAHAEIRALWESANAEAGPWGPLGHQPTIVMPGYDGGAEWGGAAVDPNTGVLYVNANEMAWVSALEEPEQTAETESESEAAPLDGAALYAQNCASCHGSERQGSSDGGFPSLEDVSHLTPERIDAIIAHGGPRMPAFDNFSAAERASIVNFLYGEEVLEAGQEPVDHAAAGSTEAASRFLREFPYQFSGYTRIEDSEGYPGLTPPWGTLTAIDMNSGEFVWQIPLGDFPEVSQGGEATGAENYGGPVVTAGGVLFIAATKDEMFRAFDMTSGELLWETQLPYGGYATPATYSVDGKQYVVIVATGGKLGTPKGDAYIAFALPD